MDHIRDSFRPTTWGWLRGTAAGLATLALTFGGIVLTVATAGEWGPAPLLLTGLGLIVIGAVWLRSMASLYQVTADRLIVRRGIVFKSIDEIELYRVKDVRLNFSLLNQWAGIGTIRITSSDETTREGDLAIFHAPRAQERREELRRLVDSARQRRGVREIDMMRDDL